MRSSIQRSNAFSLVEVVVAIGIVSFAILGVIGLLPLGLKTVRNANEEAGAANVLNGIVEAVRNASTNSLNPPGMYSNSYAGQSITFTNGGDSTNCLWSNLTLEGMATNDFGKRLSAILTFTPPSTNLITNGYGTVSVAWAGQSSPVWVSNTQTWSNNGGSIEGSMTIGFRFLPK